MQYLDTGIILKVRPRMTRDGMVFLDIVQEVSTPGAASPMHNGNVRIDTRKLKTEAAVQSGDTVMLAGLISDAATARLVRRPGPEPHPGDRRRCSAGRRTEHRRAAK